jgi:hypothetical protein
MHRLARLLTITFVACTVLALLSSSAHACPMCSQSIAEEAHLPRAYMISILFMLGMPAAVFTGIGLCIYLKFRKFYAAQPAAAQWVESPAPPIGPRPAELPGPA